MWEDDNEWEQSIFSVQSSTSATTVPGFDGGQINLSWQETVKNLRRNGYALVPFIPNADNEQFSGFKVGFRGNPEKSFSGVARYKKDWDRNDRYGVGAFIIAIPAKGHFISSLKIRGLDDSCTMPHALVILNTHHRLKAPIVQVHNVYLILITIL